MIFLNEYTKAQLIKKAKTPGFNRYSRRVTISPNEVKINQVVVGRITENPHLDVYFRVRDYISSIRLVNFMVRVRTLYNQSKYRNDIRKMLLIAMKNTLRTNDLQVNCTCPDFYYRFSYVATLKNYGFNTNQTIPAKIRNPKNKGSMCKHLTKIVNAPSAWSSKVITAVSHAIKNDPSVLEGGS